MSTQGPIDRPHLNVVETEVKNGVLMIRPVGQITEAMDFQQVLNKLGEFTGIVQAVIDLGRAERVNSRGVRNWIAFVEKIQAKVPCRFELVNEVFIEQAMTAPKILGRRGTPVESIEVPYSCSRCKTRVIEVVKVESVDLRGAKLAQPGVKCPRCGGQLVFDAIEDEYLAFLRHTIRV